MKKTLSKKSTSSKKQTLEEQIDSLARIVVSGFGRVDERFEQVDKRFEQVDKRFEQMDKRFGQSDANFTSIFHELKDHRERLERIEKRQLGTLATLDETVHRSEFKALTKRVDLLERKK